MNYIKGDQLYEGKAKVAFHVQGHDDLVWLDFKNSLTAFNAEKKGEFDGKGVVNNKISTLIFKYLDSKGVESHWVDSPNDQVMVAKKVEIILAEVVVRNTLAGSTAKKFGIEEGKKLDSPLVEFYYKDDALGDPFMSDAQAVMMNVASAAELEELKRQALSVNKELLELFAMIDIQLVDFKIEFGRSIDGRILLADEITPDTCRLWDINTGEKMDKDRFRRDLGSIKEMYEEVLKRLNDKVKDMA